ncbi:MAG TPA: SDR family oxidoreductase [Pirellulaceae bacterium]|nr:SDR family oxidoreductase [Pirellulaceae bacterium]
MTKCLVTGGCGFIGSHLVEALVRRGDTVRVLDDLSTGHAANIENVRLEVEFIRGTILDAEAVGKAMAGVELVFHQAALASVPRSVADPLATHHACVTGTVNVLDQARRAGVRRVMYAASSSAYGNSHWASKREADPPAPLSPYAAAKLAGEQYCQAFWQSYGLETICLRYFNVFGPRQDPHGPYAAVIPAFILKMQSGQRPMIFGDGKQSRDFTYIANVVAGNLAAACAAGVAGKVFNLASGRSYSLLDLVAALNHILNLNIGPVFEPARVGDVKDSLADISLSQAELGYAPTVDFSDGLQQTAEYYAAAK